MSAPAFLDATRDPDGFFAVLPPDWRADIEPCWARYADTCRIYVLQAGERVIGGGVVFSRPAPDTLEYAERAEALFARGLLYFGFLWVAPDMRGREYGGYWLAQLRRRYPGRYFWLAIEDPGLQAFYARNGFHVVDSLTTTSGTEWILTDEPA